MANTEYIGRAQRGRGEWNTWAEENPGTVVDFQSADVKRIDFAGFIFPGAVNFTGVTLGAQAPFRDAIFLETANFTSVSFEGPGDFHGATFKGEVTFHSVQFKKGSDFDGATFEGHANFLSANFVGGEADFRRTAFLQDAIFAEAKFAGGAVFSGVSFGKVAEFRSARFSGHANFQKATFSNGPARFQNARFDQIAHFGGASFGKEGADFLNTAFVQYTTFDDANFAGYANFQRAKFHEVASFRSTEWHGLANFNDTNFGSIAVFFQCIFAAVPTFHGATLHEGTTFEGVTWPERRHAGQSPYDAAAAWAWLRVEMSRLHKYEDELFFFAKELNARAHDRRNEPPAKRLLYWIYLALGSGRSVVRPLGWLLGLNVGLFPVYWLVTSAIQGRTLSIRSILADIVSFNIPADVVSFTLGHALPLVGSSSPERVDLYRRLFARADSGGIDVPLWLEFVGIFQELSGLVLLFLIGLALRNRFRMK